MPGRHTDNAPGRQKDSQTDRQVDPVAIKSNILLLLSQRGVDQSRGTRLFFFSNLFLSSLEFSVVPPSAALLFFLFWLFFFVSFCLSSALPALLCARDECRRLRAPCQHCRMKTRLCLPVCVCVGVCRLACFGSAAAVNTCLWRYTHVPIEQRTRCQPTLSRN